MELRKLLRRILAQDPHRLIDEVAHSGSWRLLPSDPQLEILRAIVISLPVAMMHLLSWQERPFQHRSHHPGMLSDVTSAVGIRMLGLPDIDVAIAAPVPTFPLI